MKSVLITLVFVAAVIFLAGYSFRSYFSDVTFVAPPAATSTPTVTQAPGGGEPRRAPISTPSSSSSSNSAGGASSGGFRGPSGPPHINGPTAPPPGS